MRSYTTTDLAKSFGVSYPTIKKWLSTIPELDKKQQRRIFTPKELEIVFRYFGQPSNGKKMFDK
jgi:transposase